MGVFGRKPGACVSTPPCQSVKAVKMAQLLLVGSAEEAMAQIAALGGKVRSLRRRAHMTQVQLASQLGISPSYLNLIEQNRRPLSAPLLIKLAEILQFDLK